jgi:hypothetical protein
MKKKIIGIFVCMLLITTALQIMNSASASTVATTFEDETVLLGNRGDWFEDFETGYDGWEYIDGDIVYSGTQSSIVYEGNYAFKMTGSLDDNGNFAGKYQYDLNISVETRTEFSFAYYFPYQNVSYVGYLLRFNSGKGGYYISYFWGSFVNTSNNYLLQYENESIGTWHFHIDNVYDNYRDAFGSVPSNLSITSVSMIMGDPYHYGEIQTAYYDFIAITVKNDPPNVTYIDGPTSGKPGTTYDYNFTKCVDPDGDDMTYHVEWGDGGIDEGFVYSGGAFTLSHTWTEEGDYTIKAKLIDTYGAESDWATLEVTMPVKQQTSTHPWLNWILERFPNTFPIIRQLIGL